MMRRPSADPNPRGKNTQHSPKHNALKQRGSAVYCCGAALHCRRTLMVAEKEVYKAFAKKESLVVCCGI